MKSRTFAPALAVIGIACADATSPSGTARLAPLVEPTMSLGTQLVDNEFIVVLDADADRGASLTLDNAVTNAVHSGITFASALVANATGGVVGNAGSGSPNRLLFTHYRAFTPFHGAAVHLGRPRP